MKKLLNQITGKEPESVYMSIVGTLAVFALPVIFVLWTVALGGK